MSTTQSVLERTVGEIMNGTPVTLPPGARVREAVQRFRDEQPAAIAIVDSAGTLCGIVTMLDLLRAASPAQGLLPSPPRALASRALATIMRPGVITLEENDRVSAALDLLIETRFHALPVVRRYGHGPVLIGMLEQRHLLPLLVAEPARRRRAATT